MILKSTNLGAKLSSYEPEKKAKVNMANSGLHSAKGAQQVITMLNKRQAPAKQLILNHNTLGNEGTNILFRFLESPAGRTHPIGEITLNSNGIGNKGLLSIARYLKDNRDLKELFVQANNFTGDPLVTNAFTEALNSSNLALLSITTNHSLGDSFIEHLLPNLNAPHLRELHISSIGLTTASVPHILENIRSRERCRLHTFRCNGNSLGLTGVQEIIKAIEDQNYSLICVELFANQIPEDVPGHPGHVANVNVDDSEDEDAPPEPLWEECMKRLRLIRARNEYLRSETHSQARELLRYARTLFLRSSSSHDQEDSPKAPNQPLPDPSSSDYQVTQEPEKSAFPFTQLPPELHLQILAHLAPILSPSQRTRVLTYASDPSTLPALLPPLKRADSSSGSCLPDPSKAPSVPLPRRSVPSPNSSLPVPFAIGGPGLRLGGRADDCSAGTCMGSINALSCKSDKERIKWLEEVGCSTYDPE